jgi:hypothetical protein
MSVKTTSDKVASVFKCPKCGARIPESLLASHMGKVSAKKLAKKRGPEFFRKLQAKRKKRAGGRPPQET